MLDHMRLQWISHSRKRYSLTPDHRTPEKQYNRALAVILLIALALRLIAAFSADTSAPYDRAGGGDEWWYLEYGVRLVTDDQVEPLSPAPLYLALVGAARVAVGLERTPPDEPHMLLPLPGGGLPTPSIAGNPVPRAVRLIFVVQALLSTATVYFGYRLGRAVSGDARAGLVVAAALATSLALIVTSANILTETLYLFFLTAALMAYTDIVAGTVTYRRVWVGGMLVGGLLGLATMTRAALLLFPVGLVAHVALLRWRGNRRVTTGAVAALLIAYVAVGSIWTTYYAVKWNRLVIGARGLTAFFYLGTQGEWEGPEAVDEALGAGDDGFYESPDYATAAAETVRSNPVAYAATRVRNLLAAYAQPYGTVEFRGPSLRAMLLEVRSPSAALALLRAEGFWPKLWIYLTHYSGIALGFVGMALAWRRWQTALVPLMLIAYVSALHLALLALPRYLFPTLPFWWVFAAVALVAAYDRLRPVQSPDWP